MEVNIRKIFGLILMIILLSLIFSSKVFASEASVSVTPNSCNVGDTFTVNINIPQDVVAYQFDIVVTYSDKTSERKHINVVGSNPNNVLDLQWAGNKAESFSAKVAGNAMISINNIVLSDINYQKTNSSSSCNCSIAIVDPSPSSTPSAETPQQPNNNNNSNSNNSNNNPPEEVTVVNFKDVNETMYVSEGSTGVNMRQNCGTSSSLIQTLKPGTEVTRTGIGDKSKNGYSWSRISYNGITGYVITGRLTYDKPKENPNENTIANNTSNTVNNEIKNEVSNEITSNNTVINNVEIIANELGSIPEVGLNIMTFIFVGSCTVCSIIVIYVKRKIAK